MLIQNRTKCQTSKYSSNSNFSPERIHHSRHRWSLSLTNIIKIKHALKTEKKVSKLHFMKQII